MVARVTIYSALLPTSHKPKGATSDTYTYAIGKPTGILFGSHYSLVIVQLHPGASKHDTRRGVKMAPISYIVTAIEHVAKNVLMRILPLADKSLVRKAIIRKVERESNAIIKANGLDRELDKHKMNLRKHNFATVSLRVLAHQVLTPQEKKWEGGERARLAKAGRAKARREKLAAMDDTERTVYNAKRAKAHREKLAAMDDTDRTVYRAKRAKAHREKLAAMDDTERTVYNAKRAKAEKERRAAMDDTERTVYRAKRAKARREKLAAMDDTDRTVYNAKRAKAHREKLAAMDDTDRTVYNAKRAKANKDRWAAMTETERKDDRARKAKEAKAKKEWRAAMTETKREDKRARRAKKDRERLAGMNETERKDKRATRATKDRERRAALEARLAEFPEVVLAEWEATKEKREASSFAHPLLGTTKSSSQPITPCPRIPFQYQSQLAPVMNAPPHPHFFIPSMTRSAPGYPSSHIPYMGQNNASRYTAPGATRLEPTRRSILGNVASPLNEDASRRGVPSVDVPTHVPLPQQTSNNKRKVSAASGGKERVASEATVLVFLYWFPNNIR